MDVLKPNLIMVLVFYFDIIVFPLFAPVSYLVNYSYGHFFFFFFGSTRVRTQGLTLAKQALW
jgi:hypothetical protein